MTPEAARQCWCPFARVEGAKVSYNRLRSLSGHTELGAPATDAICIADSCMAWRWIVSPRRIEEAKRWPETTLNAKALAACEPSGYCGVAGSHGLD
jgi:hypothetical protein